jgi:hypothetical protein
LHLHRMGWDGTIGFYYIRRLRGLALISIPMDTVLFGIVIIVVGLDIPDGESFCTYFRGCRYMTYNRNKKMRIQEDKGVPELKFSVTSSLDLKSCVSTSCPLSKKSTLK